MSDPTASSHSPLYTTPGQGTGSITKAGGALGVAASFVGFVIFFAGCAGYDAAFKFALIPMILAVPGLLLTIVGGTIKRTTGMEESHIVASLCLNLACIMGALILIAVWKGVPIFAGGA